MLARRYDAAIDLTRMDDKHDSPDAVRAQSLIAESKWTLLGDQLGLAHGMDVGCGLIPARTPDEPCAASQTELTTGVVGHSHLNNFQNFGILHIGTPHHTNSKTFADDFRTPSVI